MSAFIQFLILIANIIAFNWLLTTWNKQTEEEAKRPPSIKSVIIYGIIFASGLGLIVYYFINWFKDLFYY